MELGKGSKQSLGPTHPESMSKRKRDFFLWFYKGSFCSFWQQTYRGSPLDPGLQPEPIGEETPSTTSLFYLLLCSGSMAIRVF